MVDDVKFICVVILEHKASVEEANTNTYTSNS